MAGDVGKHAVLPAGQSILYSLFGPNYNPNGFENADLISKMFGEGGMMPVAGGVWNAGLGGRFIAPSDPYAQIALEGVYGGDPSQSSVNRFANNADRFGQWFHTGAGNIPSATELAGRRASANLGGYGPTVGNPQNYGPLNEFRMNLGRLNADPYFTSPLAPAFESRNAYQSFNENFGQPNAADYDQAAGNAFTNANNPYRFAKHGVDQTTRRGNRYEQGLLRDIDTEAQNTLGMQLPEVQAQAQALGLAESGSATRWGGDVTRSILDQANRDKQRTMAQFREGQLGREAQAINLGSQIGAQGGMQARDIRSRFGAQALADQQQINMAQRMAEQQAIQGGIGNYQQTQMGLQDQYLRALLGSDQAQLARQMGEANVQSQGQADYSNIFNMSNAYRGQTMQEMLGLSDFLRSQEQERLNQQLQFGMMPWQALMTLATGVSGGGANVQGGRATPWWQSAGQSLAGGYLGGLGQQVAQRTPDFFDGLNQD